MNDLNPVETLKEFIRTTNHLKKKFEMKDFRILYWLIGRTLSRWNVSPLINTYGESPKALSY